MTPNKRFLKWGEMENLVFSQWVCSDPVLGTHNQIEARKGGKERKQVWRQQRKADSIQKSTEAWLSLELGPVGLQMRKKESRTESAPP